MAVDLADLLTSAGNAMGIANVRLAAEGAPALLQQFHFQVIFSAGVTVPAGNATLQLSTPAPPNPQMQAMMGQTPMTNVTVDATYIAAPSLVKIPPGSVVVDP